MTHRFEKELRPWPFGTLVHEDAVADAVLARVLQRVGLFGGEEDARAVLGPLEGADRRLLIAQLRRLAAAERAQQPELRAGGVARVLRPDRASTETRCSGRPATTTATGPCRCRAAADDRCRRLLAIQIDDTRLLSDHFFSSDFV